MHTRSIPISFIVALFSIFTVLFQFGSYYFLNSILIMIGITFILTLIISHIILEISLDYNSCLFYLVLNILFGILLIFYIYFHQSNNYLFYTKWLFFIILLNWLLPISYTIVRNLFDPGPKFIGFTSYFKKASFFFVIFYMFIFFLFIFRSPIVIPAAAQLKEYNLIPFKTIAIYIEDFIYHNISLNEFLWYCAKIILLYIPYGFYIRLIFKKNSSFTRGILLLLLPIVIETIQYAYDIGRCDIDDFCLAIIGCLIGVFFYNILNSIYHLLTEEDFLYEPALFDFYDKRYYQ